MKADVAVRPLVELAGEIRDAHAEVEHHGRATVAAAIRAGEALAAAKAQLPHGQWLPWLAENFPASDRTARGYMSLAANRQRVADLPTVREALAELAAPREPKALEPPSRSLEENERVVQDGINVFVRTADALLALTPETRTRYAADLGISSQQLDEMIGWARMILGPPSPSGSAARVAVALSEGMPLEDLAVLVATEIYGPTPNDEELQDARFATACALAETEHGRRAMADEIGGAS